MCSVLMCPTRLSNTCKDQPFGLVRQHMAGVCTSVGPEAGLGLTTVLQGHTTISNDLLLEAPGRYYTFYGYVTVKTSSSSM